MVTFRILLVGHEKMKLFVRIVNMEMYCFDLPKGSDHDNNLLGCFSSLINQTGAASTQGVESFHSKG